jgi:hypothetical protein
MKFATLILILLVSIPTSLAAQPQPPSTAPGSLQPDERRTVRAVRLQPDERIVLDGHLDEQVWSGAVPASDFIQQDPDNGQPKCGFCSRARRSTWA